METADLVFGFCPACGTALDDAFVDQRPHRVCPNCGRVHWRNAKPCAGAVAWFAPNALLKHIAFANSFQALNDWAAGDSTALHLVGAPGSSSTESQKHI